MRTERSVAALDRTSIVPASLLLIAAIAFGWSRDFGAFLLAIVVLPTLALVSIAWIVTAVLAGGARPTWLGLSLALALLALPAYPLAQRLRDPIRFALWIATHQPADRYRDRDRVVTAWDSWGMAGMENDSYLVSDIDDTIGSLPRAEAWRRKLRLSCEIVASRRMTARLYIVTTADCPFGFDGHRWS